MADKKITRMNEVVIAFKLNKKSFFSTPNVKVEIKQTNKAPCCNFQIISLHEVEELLLMSF